MKSSSVKMPFVTVELLNGPGYLQEVAALMNDGKTRRVAAREDGTFVIEVHNVVSGDWIFDSEYYVSLGEVRAYLRGWLDGWAKRAQPKRTRRA